MAHGPFNDWRKLVLGWKNAGIVVDLYNEQARFVGVQEIFTVVAAHGAR